MNEKLLLLLPLFLAACGGSPSKPTPSPAAAASASLQDLQEGREVQGFVPVALYVDEANEPVGARFVHGASKFVLDYLRIESAPQGFLWTTTYPDSDKGEPHTQEHLLLGKGNRGRLGANYEHATLARSSAFTMQYRTCYHFHTVAGADAFWGVFENELGMLLHPDYSDEEIRREVRNFGLKKEADGTLRLEERGSVYNEMVRAYETPGSLAWRALLGAAYGSRHPLALSSGGYPDAIREMTPEDIRRFHEAHYHLPNMGMVGAFPASVPLSAVLARTAEILTRAGDTAPRGPFLTERELPPARPEGAPGSVRVVPYPHTSADKPGRVAFVWPATRKLPPAERLELELFLAALASDETSVLYRKLVDGKTRTMDVGATAVWATVFADPGQPVLLGLENVRAAHLDDEGVGKVQKLVSEEIAAIAHLAPGSRVVAFQDNVKARIVEQRRNLAKLLDTPPGFGFRGTGSTWIEHLTELGRAPGFRKSLTLREDLARMEALVGGDGNPWSKRLSDWGLLGAAPVGVAMRASPELRRKLDDERRARADAELARLQARFGTKDPRDTLKRYQLEVDAKTKGFEAAEADAPMPPFVSAPPMTLDDGLAYEVMNVAGVPLVASTFDSMKSATVGLALRLDAVPESLLLYLPILPSLLRESGVVEDGKVVPYEVMRERLRKEILDLSVAFDTNLRTGRAELVVRGSGNDQEETRRALAWMGRILAGPYLEVENLPRLRDLSDQVASSYRNVMQGAEEAWVNDPPGFFHRQDHALLARTASFLTMAHDVHRLRWLLADGGDEAQLLATDRFFKTLEDAGRRLDRAALGDLARALETPLPPKDRKALAPYLAAAERLPSGARAIAVKAGRDLGQLLFDLPDESLAQDWAFLCREMAADLRVPPRTAMADLRKVVAAVLHQESARLDFVGSKASREALAPDLLALTRKLPAGTYTKVTYASQRRVEERLRERGAPGSTAYLGLVNPNTQGGVFVNSAPGATFADREDAVLLDYLTANTYAGHGAHGIFMKTWAAGLAYSNGLRGSPASGRLGYYAERCPDLAQTLRFVVETLKRAEPGARLVDYAVANAFSARGAATFESRGAEMAADLADGVTPEQVRGFRQKLLEMRTRPHLERELFRRLAPVYGRVLPGLAGAGPVPDALHFVIGPPAQLDAFERYLATLPGAPRLQRLYPRDFWVPGAAR